MFLQPLQLERLRRRVLELLQLRWRRDVHNMGSGQERGESEEGGPRVFVERSGGVGGYSPARPVGFSKVMPTSAESQRQWLQ